MTRWWNVGRYERECAEFDAAQPEARRVWESLQRHRRAELIELALMPWPQLDSINAITEGGLANRVKLHIDFPMHCGVAYL